MLSAADVGNPGSFALYLTFAWDTEQFSGVIISKIFNRYQSATGTNDQRKYLANGESIFLELFSFIIRLSSSLERGGFEAALVLSAIAYKINGEKKQEQTGVWFEKKLG